MGLRERFGIRLPTGGPVRQEGVAKVLRSRPVSGDEHREGVIRNDEVVSNDLWYLNLGKRPHWLTLEVRLPGVEPYEAEIRTRVPAKFAPGSSLTLPEGIDLPVRKTGDGPADIEIQWRAFDAKPGAKRDVKVAAGKAHNDAVREGLERANPEQQAMLRESNAAQLPHLVQQVRDGKLKRKTFDQSMQTLVILGQLDEALLEAAKTELDGP